MDEPQTELSPGVLSDSLTLLELCSDKSSAMSLDDLKIAYKEKIGVAEREAVLSFAQSCRWLTITSIGLLQLTNKGRKIIAMDEYLRPLEQIYDFLSTIQPPWSRLLKTGRTAKQYMPADAIQTFEEANLFGMDEQSVQAWDRLTGAVEGFGNRHDKEKTGRFGERLTVLWEKDRTGIEPNWVALDSDKAGYDVLSHRSAKGEKMAIEVKTTKQPIQFAFFHITRHEWKTAVVTPHYRFYLWSISEKLPVLYIVEPDKLKTNVPDDRGKGTWESVKIPFSVVESKKLAKKHVANLDSINSAIYN